jgi:hypothetical protein
MLGRDVLVLHLLRLFLRGLKDLRRARAEVLLAALHLREARDRRLKVVRDDLYVRAELSEDGAHDTLRLFEHREQKVFGLDLLVLVALGGLYRGLYGLLASKCETF